MTDKVYISFEFYNSSQKVALIAPRSSMTNSEWSKAIRQGLNKNDTYTVISNDSQNSIIEFPSKSVFILTVKDRDAEDTTTVQD